MTKQQTTYQKLLQAVDNLPKEAIEKTDKSVTRKGYDTTGYQYQYLVNVLNEVLGIDGWDMDYTTINETTGSWSNGKSYFSNTVDLDLWITVGDQKAHRKSPGGHTSSEYYDAQKGAVTNALKKTLGLFGVGKRAYEGTIDEDYRSLEGDGGTTETSDAQLSNIKLSLAELNDEKELINYWKQVQTKNKAVIALFSDRKKQLGIK